MATIQQMLAQLAGGDRELGKALNSGFDFGSIFFGNGGLGRVDPNLTEFQAEDLNRLRAESFQAGNRSAGATEALALLRDQAVNGGRRSDDVANLIRSRQAQFDNAGNVSPDVQLALDKRRAGIDGLTASERNLFRDEGQSGINRNLQSALRGARSAGLTSGVAGNINSIPVQNAAREAVLASRGLENDIGQFNIGLKDKRLGDFESLARGIDNTRFERTQNTLGSLQDLIRGDEADRFNRAANARASFADRLRGQEQDETSARTNALNNLLGFRERLRQDQFNRQAFNFGQVEKEIGGLLGTTFGFGSFNAAQQGREAAEALAKEQLEIQRNAPAPSFGNPFEGLLPLLLQSQQAQQFSQPVSGQGFPSAAGGQDNGLLPPGDLGQFIGPGNPLSGFS